MLRPATVLPALLAAGLAQGATFTAQVLAPAGRPVADAAVVLEPLAPAPAPSRPRAGATIEQRGKEFLPYVTVVQTGAAIDFPNNDKIRHHVYSFSPPKRFEIKLYAGKPGQPVTFDKPGEVVIGCNIHDWMEAWVLVVDSPWFAKTGADGRALIANVPAGQYRLRLWHPLQQRAAATTTIQLGPDPASHTFSLDVKPRERKPHDEDTDAY